MYQYQQQQQQSNLPFDPINPMNPFLNIQIGNPPHLPRIPVDQNVQYYLPLIASIAAIEIQNNVAKNPLRMFMFNQYSQNNFANSDFDSLIAVTVDYIQLNLMKANGGDVERAIGVLVPQMVEIAAALNLRIFPDLARYLDQYMASVAQNHVRDFDNVMNDINYMKGRGQQQQYGGGGYNPGYNQPRAAYGGGGQPTSMAGRVGNAPDTSRNSSALFTPHNTQARSDNVGGSSISDRFSVDSPLQQPFTPRKEPVMEPEQQQQPVVQELIPLKEGVKKWKPSAKFPYLPLYNPARMELSFRAHPDGSIEPVLKEKLTMDYDAHNIGAPFGPLPQEFEFKNSSETLESVSMAISSLSAEATTDREESEPVPEPVYVNTSVYAETSLDSAWFLSALSRLGVTKDGKAPFAYRTYARITTPTIHTEDESAVIKNYASAMTFIELREKMNATCNSVSKGLWALCNTKMTAAINRILKNQLSLPNWSMESFVIDIAELISTLESKHGSAIKQVFVTQQRAVIQSVFQLMWDETAKTMAEDYLEGNSGEAKPVITFLSSDVSMTYLDCLGAELEIALPTAKVACALTPNVSPLLYRIVTSIFDDVRVKEGNFERHYIRTADGITLEASRGIINTGYYTLTVA